MTTLHIIDAFDSISDPRYRTPDYPLRELILVALCAVLAGADDWCSISLWGKNHLHWLKNYLPFKHGIASHDTFGRVFAAIKTTEFEASFIQWVKNLCPDLDIKALAIDGKTICRSHDRRLGKKAIHMVSAFAPGVGISLGQLKTEEKSNEITAIPQLLDLLEIKGCVVSIDAMGNQKKIAEKIIKQGGDYLLAVKGNQKTQEEEIVDFFTVAEEADYEGVNADTDIQTEKDHGRIETRRVVSVSDVSCLSKKCRWPGMKSMVMVESTREINAKKTMERRYYVTSADLSAKEVGQRVRGHWEIENRLHWNLDVSFGEDQSRIRVGNASENMSILRRLALNLLRVDKSIKLGIKNKRKAAGWSTDYLEKVLNLKKV